MCCAKKASSPSCSGVPKRSDELISEGENVDVGGGSGGGRNRLARSSIVGGTKRWEIAEIGMLEEGEGCLGGMRTRVDVCERRSFKVGLVGSRGVDFGGR